MDDLLLFRILREGRLSAPELAALLEDAARLTPAARAPFLGLLGPLLGGSEARLRASALRCLGGCEGLEAVKTAAARLSDEDEEVREAAVGYFRGLAAKQRWRWAHVVFHPDVRVRRAALAEGPLPAATMGFYLVPDPECGEQAMARFYPGEAGEERWPLPEDAARVVLDLVASGGLSRARGRRLLTLVQPDLLQSLAARGRSRSEQALKAWLEQAAYGAAPPAPSVAGDEDELDAIFDLLCLDEGEGEAERKLVGDFMGRLSTSKLTTEKELNPRLSVALIRRLALGGAVPPGTLELLAEVHPASLAYAWIERKQRREALRALYKRGEGLRKAPKEVVETIVESDLALHERGGLDLWALGGVLYLVQGAPYEVLLEWASIDLVLDAFLARSDESMPFLGHEDSSSRGTAYVLDKLRRRMPERAAQIMALWALTAPLEQLDVLTIKPEEEDQDDRKKRIKQEKWERWKKKKAGLAPPPPPPPPPPPAEANKPKEPKRIGPEAALVIFQALVDVERQGRQMPQRRAEKLAEVLGPYMGGGRGHLASFVAAWLGGGDAEPPPLGVHLLLAMARPLEADAFAGWAAGLPARLLVRLLSALAFCTTLPFAKERALAQALLKHADARVQEWARSRVPTAEVKLPPAVADGLPLTAQEADDLRLCPDGELAGKLGALAPGRPGVVAALRGRSVPDPLRAEACVAVLASGDPLPEVDRLLGELGSGEAAFLQKVDQIAVKRLANRTTLPVVAHAWMHLWERNAFLLLEALIEGRKPLAEGLAPYLGALHTPWVKARLIDAVGRLVGLLAYRDRERLTLVCSLPLAQLFVRELTGSAGYAAAEGLVLLHRSKAAPDVVASVAPAVQGLLPDLTEAVRERLAGWIDARGLPPAPEARRAAQAVHAVDIATVRASRDPDELARWCELGTMPVVEEAVLRLLELNEPGLRRLVQVAGRAQDRVRLRPLCDTLDLWPAGDMLNELRAQVTAALGMPADVRFALAMALVARGDEGAWAEAIEAACAPGPAWFSAEDWEAMIARHKDRPRLARALAASPQPHAYLSAVESLLSMDKIAGLLGDVRAGLVAFLSAGTLRLSSLRMTAALWLWERGAWEGLPVLIAARAEGQAEPKALLRGADAGEVVAAARSMLLLGGGREQTLLELLQEAPPHARSEALEALIDLCVSNDTRRAAVKLVEDFPHRSQKLAQIAETFAWGVHRGRELLGGYYKVEMVDGQGLGYTRLNEKRIFVSPLPILRRERGGRDLVEALILHELGHHRYHRGEQADRCWKEAHKEGITGIYNLVLDEHLERNLRALDEEYGDRLKRLAAYAFQHSVRQVPVESLLSALGARAAAVLTQTRLRPARAEACVVVESGALLLAMEKQEMAFSRFMRSLRMGLGGRRPDPRVDLALALFKGGFRRKNAQEMLDVAREIKRIFGSETSLLECTGSHESLSEGADESIANGDCISPQEVDEEVERVLNPKKRAPSKEITVERGKMWININPGAEFSKITSVTRLHHDRAQAEALARQVRRQAFHLRRFLEDLGLARVPERRRIQGHRFDPTRAQAMVLRNDPRVLIARRLEIHSDVFLSVVVDCSGSMQSFGRIERARLFAALIAEAARGLRGLDLRVFGFTDQVIYDAGDASHCAAHNLNAGGGNNDAAALYYAAQVAKQSRRRSRVLVMISDGLPTECSVAALRGLVEQLSRREHMVCAQVAVAKLAEVCFPHHVLLDDDNTDVAVRRFGAMVGGLVRRSMTG